MFLTIGNKKLKVSIAGWRIKNLSSCRYFSSCEMKRTGSRIFCWLGSEEIEFLQRSCDPWTIARQGDASCAGVPAAINFAFAKSA